MAQNPWDEFKPTGAAPSQGVVIQRPSQEVTAEQLAKQSAANDAARLGIAARGEVRDIESTNQSKFESLFSKYGTDPAVVKYQKVLPIFDTMVTIASRANPSKADDNFLITLGSKIKDPGTGVLGGEFETTKDIQTSIDRTITDLKGLYDPESGFVSPQARRQFLIATRDLIASDRRAYDFSRNRYKQLATDPTYNVNPDAVIGEDFANAYKDRIKENFLKVMGAGSEAADKATIDLKVAEGDRFATDKDIENASILQGMWKSGKSIEELNAKSIELTGGSPLDASTINALRKDPNRTIRWTPARSGIREGSASQIGLGEAAAASAIRGYTSNLGEEILSTIFNSPETASKLQAAGEAGMKEYPIVSALTEIPSSLVSPVN